MKRVHLLVLGSLIMSAVGAFAQQISLTNPGFEDPAIGDGDSTQGFVPGYTLSGTSITGVFNPTDAFFQGTSGGPVPPPGAGQQIAYIFTNQGATPGMLTQTTGATVAANTVYTLSVAVGQAAASLNRPFAGYEITLLAGNVVLATEANLITPAAGSFALADVTYTSGGAADPNVGQPLTLRLASTLTGPSGSTLYETFFDEVRLTAAPVPEPTTTALLGIAALSGYAWVRRARNQRGRF